MPGNLPAVQVEPSKCSQSAPRVDVLTPTAHKSPGPPAETLANSADEAILGKSVDGTCDHVKPFHSSTTGVGLPVPEVGAVRPTAQA
jgi:hypothetical protein